MVFTLVCDIADTKPLVSAVDIAGDAVGRSTEDSNGHFSYKHLATTSSGIHVLSAMAEKVLLLLRWIPFRLRPAVLILPNLQSL
jgi:hypothetical protein